MNQPDKQVGVAGLFVVGFYDILGQSEQFKQWSDFKEVTKPGSFAHTAMLQSVGIVERVRENFRKVFEGFIEFDPSEVPPGFEQAAERYPEVAKFWKSRKPHPLGRMAFSDTNIWFVPISSEGKEIASREISAILIGIAFTHMLSLANGVVGRGSVTIGSGVNSVGVISGGAHEIYGPVLLDAYNLEAKEAKYPRVIVSKKLTGFFRNIEQDVSGLDPNTIEFASRHYMNSNFKICRDLIFEDEDGCLALDYAGQWCSRIFLNEMAGMGVTASELYGRAYEFVYSERNRFKLIGNQKLEERYACCLRYLERCKPYW